MGGGELGHPVAIVTRVERNGDAVEGSEIDMGAHD